jgi:hypothetical protein
VTTMHLLFFPLMSGNLYSSYSVPLPAHLRGDTYECRVYMCAQAHDREILDFELDAITR